MAHAFVIAQCDEVAELLGVVLKRRGMTANYFRDGKSALSALRDDPGGPDAIIVGCVAPIMTGQRDLLLNISKTARALAERTIVLTDAPDAAEVAADARSMGIPVVLPMPFDLDQLGSALDRLTPRGPDGGV